MYVRPGKEQCLEWARQFEDLPHPFAEKGELRVGDGMTVAETDRETLIDRHGVNWRVAESYFDRQSVQDSPGNRDWQRERDRETGVQQETVTGWGTEKPFKQRTEERRRGGSGMKPTEHQSQTGISPGLYERSRVLDSWCKFAATSGATRWQA
jgi:hypothetical protein